MINNQTNAPTDPLRLLKLMQLADSALPVGATAHSFGLETLVAEEVLNADALPCFLRDYLHETGVLEAAFCRAAYRLADGGWSLLNARLSARKPAHETRVASLTLGRRLIQLYSVLEESEDPGGDSHYATAFGHIGRQLEIEEDITAAVYLHQSINSLVSACQRLMPLGQQRAARMLWDLKPVILEAARASDVADPDTVAAFAPMTEMASMRHAVLGTRLFIS